jgi:hypothetical protein
MLSALRSSPVSTPSIYDVGGASGKPVGVLHENLTPKPDSKPGMIHGETLYAVVFGNLVANVNVSQLNAIHKGK